MRVYLEEKQDKVFLNIKMEVIIMNNVEKIREFLERFSGGVKIKDTDNIFELGIANSLFAMQLISFVEDEFGVTVEDDELELDNFKDVISISNFIDSKKR